MRLYLIPAMCFILYGCGVTPSESCGPGQYTTGVPFTCAAANNQLFLYYCQAAPADGGSADVTCPTGVIHFHSTAVLPIKIDSVCGQSLLVYNYKAFVVHGTEEPLVSELEPGAQYNFNGCFFSVDTLGNPS